MQGNDDALHAWLEQVVAQAPPDAIERAVAGGTEACAARAAEALWGVGVGAPSPPAAAHPLLETATVQPCLLPNIEAAFLRAREEHRERTCAHAAPPVAARAAGGPGPGRGRARGRGQRGGGGARSLARVHDAALLAVAAPSTPAGPPPAAAEVAPPAALAWEHSFVEALQRAADPAINLLADADARAHVSAFVARVTAQIAAAPEHALDAYARARASFLAPPPGEGRAVLRDALLRHPAACLRDASLNDVALAHVARVMGVVVLCPPPAARVGDPSAAHTVVTLAWDEGARRFQATSVEPIQAARRRLAIGVMTSHRALHAAHLAAALSLEALRAAFAACVLDRTRALPAAGRVTKAALAGAIADAASADKNARV